MNKQKIWSPLVLIAAIAAFVYLINTKPTVESADIHEGLRKVRYVRAKPVTVRKVAVGYGRAVPAREWTGICEVRGKIVEVGEAVREGHLISQGSLICKIDATEYNLLVTQRKLKIQQLKIQQKELEEEQRNLQKLIAIDEKQIGILRGEYERKRRLREQDTSSQAQVELAEQNLLKQENVLQQRRNALEVASLKLENTETSMEVAETQLRLAEMDLAKTVIESPFDLRISYEDIELKQFVAPGQVLVRGHAVDEMEVWGQFKYSDMREVLPLDKMDFAEGLDNSAGVFEKLDIEARIEPMIPSPRNEKEVLWSGKVSRFRSSVDIASQTPTLVIKVEDPYRRAIAEKKPPLEKGLFCKATLFGDEQKGRFCVPRAAFFSRAEGNGEVLLIEDGKLRKRQVELLYFQGDYAVVEGISEGDRIIISDVFPAVPNMLLMGEDATEEVEADYPWFIEEETK